MKRQIHDYTFDASLQTLTFDAYSSIDLARVLAVANTTDGIIMFDPSNPSKTGTASTNVLTLSFDTTSMADSDSLLVLYDAQEDKLIIDETTSSTFDYHCLAAPGSATSAAVWRISRLTLATGVWEDADGDDGYDNIFDNRASLTYS